MMITDRIRDLYKTFKSSAGFWFFILGIPILIGIEVYDIYRYKELEKDPEFTTGSIYKISHGTRGVRYYIDYFYYVGNKEYCCEQICSIDPVFGEKYYVAYQKDNPSNSRLLLNHPYFNYEDSLVERISGCVLSKGVNIEIGYKYNCRNFEFVKEIPYGLELAEKDSVELKILKSNPEISIICSKK